MKIQIKLPQCYFLVLIFLLSACNCKNDDYINTIVSNNHKQDFYSIISIKDEYCHIHEYYVSINSLNNYLSSKISYEKRCLKEILQNEITFDFEKDDFLKLSFSELNSIGISRYDLQYLNQLRDNKKIYCYSREEDKFFHPYDGKIINSLFKSIQGFYLECQRIKKVPIEKLYYSYVSNDTIIDLDLFSQYREACIAAEFTRRKIPVYKDSVSGRFVIYDSSKLR